MPSRSLNLIINSQTGGVLSSYDSTASGVSPSFVFGDSVPINLRLVEPTDIADQPWRDIDLTDQTVRLGIGVIGADATSGDFTLTYDGDTTPALAYNATAATVATALNTLASIIAEGDVTVTSGGTGIYKINFVTVGVTEDITATTDNLSPASGAIISEITEGTASVKASYLVKIEVLPVALTDLETELPSQAIAVTTVREGASGVSDIQSISLDPIPTSGTYTLTIATQETATLDFDSTDEEIQAAIEGLAAIGSGNASVTGEFPNFTITFASSLGDVGAITGTALNLIIPKGRSGILSVNTTGFSELLASRSRLDATLEIEIIDTDDTVWTASQLKCTLYEDVIPNTPMSITPMPTYSQASGVEDNADVTDTDNVRSSGALMDDEVTNLADLKAFDSSNFSTATGVEDNADVTDTANVRSSGAVMDDELTSISNVKALDQSLISGASPNLTIANMTLVDTDLIVADATNLQTFANKVDAASLRVRGTGIATSYVSTVAVGGTTFAQPAVEGEITSDEGYFGISYAGATGITVADLSSTSTWVYIDKNSALQQQTTAPTRQDRTRKAFVMRIGVNTSTNQIINFEYDNNPIGHYANSLRDLYEFLLVQGVPFKKDMVITGRVDNLGFDVSAGSLLEFGGTGDINNPNIKEFDLVDNTSYNLMSRTALVSSETNLVKEWDNATTITALGSTTCVGHRVYRFSSGNFAIQYGQGNYANMVLAKAGVKLEEYVLNPVLKDATFLGWWLLEETATATSGTVDAEFVEYTLGVQGGSSSGLSGAMLRGNNGSDVLDALQFLTNIGADKYNFTDVNVTAGAFDVSPTSLSDGARYKVATAGAVGGVWYALNSLLEVKSGLFEPIGNNIYDPSGNVVVNMVLADMTGIVPAEGTLGEVGNIPVIGDGSTTGGKAVVMRAAAGATATGTGSLALGLDSEASGDASRASGNNSTASGANSVASGFYSVAGGNNSVASGITSIASGNYSVASGSSSFAGGDYSVASGKLTKTTVNNTQEIGHWSNSTTRATSLRTQGDGQVAYTIKDTATAPTDGGATAGSEADGTLGREMMTIQRNGDAITLYVNDAGTIKSLALGSAS